MIVLGIDPGHKCTGWAIIQMMNNSLEIMACGCISPSQKLSSEDKRNLIFDQISSIIEKEEPDILAIEDQYVGPNPKTALTLGMVRGIAILSATQRNIKVVSYPPATIKKAVTGKGNATKEQIQEMIKCQLSLTKRPEPDDLADALAIAITCLHRQRPHA